MPSQPLTCSDRVNVGVAVVELVGIDVKKSRVRVPHPPFADITVANRWLRRCHDVANEATVSKSPAEFVSQVRHSPLSLLKTGHPESEKRETGRGANSTEIRWPRVPAQDSWGRTTLSRP